jgi:hypothetical protein
MRVLKTLGIEAIADLSFASAAPGDASAIISPTDKQAARFTVQGEANAYFAITLPKAITLTTGNGAKNETILVSDFASYPASSGVIASNGNAEISVGATRAPLASNQKDGVYSGTFTVEVVY